MSKFAVADFFKEKTQDGRIVVELIPASWMHLENGMWSCVWPPEEDYENVDEWIKNERPPEQHWKKETEFEILAWAANYDSGIHRLERSYVQRENLESTDTEMDTAGPIRITRAEARRLVQSTDRSRADMDTTSSDSSDEEPPHKKSKFPLSKNLKVKRRLTPIDESDEDKSERSKSSPGPRMNKSTVDDQPDRKLDQHGKENKKIASSRKSAVQSCSRLVFGNDDIHPGSSGLPKKASFSHTIDDNRLEEHALLDGKFEKHSASSQKSPQSTLSIEDLVKRRTMSVEERALRQQLQAVRNKVTDPTIRVLFDYVDVTRDVIVTKCNEKMNNIKRSMAYDFEKKMESFKGIVANEIHHIAAPNKSSLEILGIDGLPIPTLEDFVKFEKALDPLQQIVEDEKKVALEKQEALKLFFTEKIMGATDCKKSAKILLNLLLTRQVQVLYSGTGRVIKGKGKLPFNATKSYKCMEHVLTSRFPEDTQKVINYIGNELTAAIVVAAKAQSGGESEVESN